MYTDLRQYISTQRCKVEEYTYGWYVKQFCEYCKNPVYVDDFLKSLKLNLRQYDMNDVYLFEGLIDDYHTQDVLDLGENIMLKIILSCFVDDFILETDNRGYFSQFMEYAKTAQIALGKQPDLLAEWLENNFSDFAHMESEDGSILTVERLSDEMRKGYNRLEEFHEESYMSSALLVIDENAENIIELETFLELLNLIEVIPGLYYTGVIDYGGYAGDCYSLSNANLKEIMKLLSNEQKQRDLEDDFFCELNIDRYNDKVEQLVRRIKYCSSHREVMF